MMLRVHHVMLGSRANGPGKRAVIWLQGCSFRCPGCFNPILQDPDGGYDMAVTDVANKLIPFGMEIEGITVSGGEPVEQIEPLIHLFSIIKKKTRFSIVLFSGRTLEEMHSMEKGPKLLSLVDVLVDGPFDNTMAGPEGTWPSSANQHLILLSSRYTKADFQEIPWQDIFIAPTGEMIETGLFGWLGMAPDYNFHQIADNDDF